MEDNRAIVRNTIWNTFGSFIYLGAMWLLSILIVRLGSYSEAGVLSMATAVANVVQSVSLAGVRNYQVSDVEGQYTDYTYIVTRYLTSTVAMAGCVCFLLVNGYEFYQTLCILAMSIYRIVDGLTDVYHGILQKKWRLDIVGKSLFLRGIGIAAAYTIILLYTKNLLYSIIGMTAVSVAVFLFIELKKVKKLNPIKKDFRKAEIIRLCKQVVPLTAYLMLLNSMTVVTRYFIELQCGEEALGYYSSIASPALIVQVAATYIFNPFIGMFADYYNQKDIKAFKQLGIKLVCVLVALFAAAIIACKLLGSFGLKLLFGEEVLQYEYLLIPIVITTAQMAVVLFCSMLLVVVRDLKGVVIANGISFLINMVGVSFAIEKYQMQGANYVLIITLLIDIVLLLLFLLSNIKRNILKEK